MALTFDDRKLLPMGVHVATLAEVEECFARFQKSDRRLNLFGKLREYISAVRKAECGVAVILDGSFIMPGVDEPGDIDLVLLLPANWDVAAELKPYQYNLISKRRVKKEYGFDVVPVREGSPQEQDWTEFFCRVNVKWSRKYGWPAESTKGIVKVML